MRKTLDERLNQAIASRYSCKHMSNAKWRKVFLILTSPELGLRVFRYRVVPLDAEDEEYIPRYLDRLPPLNMICEKWIGDCLAGGPLDYREIEWIEIPARYPERAPGQPIVQQDIAAAARALERAGQFPIELTDEWLRVFGYQ